MIKSHELTGVTPEVKIILVNYDKERREEKVLAIAGNLYPESDADKLADVVSEVSKWSDEKIEMEYYQLTQ